MYLTHIDCEFKKADSYFPTINYSEWDSTLLGSNMDNGISYKHVLYKRKKQ